MNRAEREQLLERYLSGGMTSGDESDFFIQVALDKELRQELKAQRVIESALRKDEESESTEHTALRSRVAAMLASTSAAQPAHMAAPVPSWQASTPRRRRWAVAPMQWLLASGVALAFTVGTMFLLPTGKLSAPLMSTPTDVAPRTHRGGTALVAARNQSNTPAANATEDGAASILRNTQLVSGGNTPAPRATTPRVAHRDAGTRVAVKSRRNAPASDDLALQSRRSEPAPVVPASERERPLNVGVTIQIPTRKAQ